ncbi:MAG: uncharacterized protein PWQ82_1273 [Thermosediminibacterales bacterium]|nr:uncharacterized protein [Thermosediminibacterales bacterium]
MNIETIKQKAVPILRKYGIKKASVFGSFARYEQTKNSDIDILIEYSPGVEKSLLKRIELKNELQKALNKDVDVMTEQAISPLIRENVLKEKREIF